ncbi:MAG: hypothetical protein R2865_02110 [Deinococcales bacterium]
MKLLQFSKKFRYFAFLWLFLLVACPASKTASSMHIIKGQIFNDVGEMLKQAQVVVFSENGQLLRTQSNSLGEYLLAVETSDKPRSLSAKLLNTQGASYALSPIILDKAVIEQPLYAQQLYPLENATDRSAFLKSPDDALILELPRAITTGEAGFYGRSFGAVAPQMAQTDLFIGSAALLLAQSSESPDLGGGRLRLELDQSELVSLSDKQQLAHLNIPDRPDRVELALYHFDLTKGQWQFQQAAWLDDGFKALSEADLLSEPRDRLYAAFDIDDTEAGGWYAIGIPLPNFCLSLPSDLLNKGNVWLDFAPSQLGRYLLSQNPSYLSLPQGDYTIKLSQVREDTLYSAQVNLKGQASCQSLDISLAPEEASLKTLEVEISSNSPLERSVGQFYSDVPTELAVKLCDGACLYQVQGVSDLSPVLAVSSQGKIWGFVRQENSLARALATKVFSLETPSEFAFNFNVTTSEAALSIERPLEGFRLSTKGSLSLFAKLYENAQPLDAHVEWFQAENFLGIQRDEALNLRGDQLVLGENSLTAIAYDGHWQTHQAQVNVYVEPDLGEFIVETAMGTYRQSYSFAPDYEANFLAVSIRKDLPADPNSNSEARRIGFDVPFEVMLPDGRKKRCVLLVIRVF